MYSYAHSSTKKPTNKGTRPKPQQHPWMKKRMARRAERQSKRSFSFSNQKNNIPKSVVMTKIKQMVNITWNDLSENLNNSGLIRLIGADIAKFLPYAQLPNVPIELKALIVIAQSEEFEDAGALKKTIENVKIAKNDEAVEAVLTKYFDNKISDIIEEKTRKNILNPMRVVQQTREYIEVIKDINQGEKEITKNGNNKTGFQYQNTENKLQDAKNRMKRLINAFDFRGVQGLNLPKDFKKTETQIKISKENNAKPDKPYPFGQPFKGFNDYNNNNLNKEDAVDIFPEMPQPDKQVDYEPFGENMNNSKMKFDYGNQLPGNPLQGPATYGKLPDGRKYDVVTLKLNQKYPPKTEIDPNYNNNNTSFGSKSEYNNNYFESFNKNINKVNDGNLSKWIKLEHTLNDSVVVDMSIEGVINLNTGKKCKMLMSANTSKEVFLNPENEICTRQQTIVLTKNGKQWTISGGYEFEIPENIGVKLLQFSKNPAAQGNNFSVEIDSDGVWRLADKLTNEQEMSKNKIPPKSRSRRSKVNNKNYDLDEEDIDNSKMLKSHLNTKNMTNYWDNVNK